MLLKSILKKSVGMAAVLLASQTALALDSLKIALIPLSLTR
ncbi:hypothetical protein [Endozoicomonas arenosclerae]|nr:hypothetical protein [Endozoicomonas arenosclerae]